MQHLGLCLWNGLGCIKGPCRHLSWEAAPEAALGELGWGLQAEAEAGHKLLPRTASLEPFPSGDTACQTLQQLMQSCSPLADSEMGWFPADEHAARRAAAAAPAFAWAQVL